MLATLLATLIPAESAATFLAARDLPVPEDHEKALALAVRSSGAKTQGEVAALVVNLTKGQITGAQLTDVLKAAFPSDKVGDRHGPYYLSLCRTGKIKVDFAPAKKATTKDVLAADQNVTALNAKIAELTEKLRLTEQNLVMEVDKSSSLDARIAKALGCSSAKDIKAALTE